MRPSLLIAAAATALALSGAASAAEVGAISEIRVSFGKDVERQNKIYGEREKAELTEELKRAVTKELGPLATSGGVLEVTIKDVKANRPTWTQQRYQPDISYAYSFGVGGADIESVYVAPDGTRTPVKYSWYELDIRNARYVSDWHDAERTFARFAKKLAES